MDLCAYCKIIYNLDNDHVCISNSPCVKQEIISRNTTILMGIDAIADGLIDGIAIGHINVEQNAKQVGELLKIKVNELKEVLKLK